jgi:hypothetical protein
MIWTIPKCLARQRRPFRQVGIGEFQLVAMGQLQAIRETAKMLLEQLRETAIGEHAFQSDFNMACQFRPVLANKKVQCGGVADDQVGV